MFLTVKPTCLQAYRCCETLKIYNLNMQMCKLSYKYKTESGMISMSDGNQDEK